MFIGWIISAVFWVASFVSAIVLFIIPYTRRNDIYMYPFFAMLISCIVVMIFATMMEIMG